MENKIERLIQLRRLLKVERDEDFEYDCFDVEHDCATLYDSCCDDECEEVEDDAYEEIGDDAYEEVEDNYYEE